MDETRPRHDPVGGPRFTETETETADLDVRAEELDQLQTLGRRAAEALTPRELFVSVLRVLEARSDWFCAAACHALHDRPELLVFPTPGAAVPGDALRARAARLLGLADRAALHVEQLGAGGGPGNPADEAAQLVDGESLLVLPVLRGNRPCAYLMVLPRRSSIETGHRMLHAATNLLSIHIDRIESGREAEAGRFRAILESMPQAVWMIGPRGETLEANRAALTLLERVGFDQAEGSGQAIERLGLGAIVEDAGSVEAGSTGREIVLDGQRVFSVTATRLGVDRRSSSILLVLTEVTEGRRLQQQLAQSEKMSSLGQMISGVAHELNNPLATILGYAQLLSATTDDPKLSDRMNLLNDEARRCQKIVQNLLSFARRREPESRRLSLNEVAQSVHALMQYQLRVDNVSLELDLSREIPAMLGDVHQLQQVLVNLVTNARQAIGQSGSEGGTIQLVTRAGDGDVLELDVVDSGPGIPAEIRPRIFDPFFTTKEEGQGTGLGLSLVYGIVRSHGGTVEALPQHAGARIRCRFPSRDEQIVAEAEGDEPPEKVRPGPARVLVVEDEPGFARLLCEALRQEGHTVEWATDGAAALERLGADSFDLIISDLRMPGMDGPTLRRRIEQRHPRMVERMLWTTGDTVGEGDSSPGGLLEARMLHKPFDLTELRAMVHERLVATGRER